MTTHPGRTIEFRCWRDGHSEQRAVRIEQCVIAGWTGRDRVALEKHIAELEAIGVKRPATTPIFYRVAAARVTTDEVIEAVGDASSGEAEFVLVRFGGELWVGAGSDHTDRAFEVHGITASKQMCDKPVAPELWLFSDVEDHWDRLILRSFAVDGGRRAPYQEGPVTAMLDPRDLVGRYTEGKDLPDGTIMFCGTLAAHGGIRAAERFEYELEDPVSGRAIRSGYDVKTLPILG